MDYALTHITASPEIILPCFCRYMLSTSGTIPTQKEFLFNMEEKMHSPDFLSDTRPILLPSVPYAPQTAYTRLCDTLLSQLDIYCSQAGVGASLPDFFVWAILELLSGNLPS